MLNVEKVMMQCSFKDEDARQEFALGVVEAMRELDQTRPEAEQAAFLRARGRGRALHFLRNERARRYGLRRNHGAQEIAEAQGTLRADLSADEEGSSYWDLLADPKAENPAESMSMRETAARVRAAMEKIRPEYRAVLEALAEGKNLSEQAREMGLSRMALCKRAKKAREAVLAAVA